jgi:class 3 adenylate cyclase
MERWWSERAQGSASPGAARDLVLMNSQIDIRDLLPTVRVPTLVLHRAGDRDSRPEEGRYIAARIPGARYIELPGADHVPWIDADQIVDHIAEFLTGARGTTEAGRILSTMLFTDLVASTARASELGDHRWSDTLELHNQAVRSEIARFAGEEINTTGDGFLALFDGPARAVRCAITVRDRVANLGMHIRAGVHTAEIVRAGKDVRGIGVHVAARVAAAAGPDEVLVSATTKDLVAGSGLVFHDRGEFELKGVDDARRLFAAST